MRKTFLFALLFISICSQAQVSLKFGLIKSSVNVSGYKDAFKYESNITPLFGGVYYRFNALNTFGFETGLQYQGYAEKFFETYEKRHYLSIPLAINYKPTALFSPGIGIQASHLIASYYLQTPLIDNKFDLSAFTRLNINPTKSIGVEIGYNLGFLPFSTIYYTDDAGNALGESKSRNSYFHFALKYTI